MMSLSMENPMFVIHFAATWAMFGIIWLVQLVQYPAFRFVDPVKFEAFHQFHSNNITVIVGPLMMAELITGFLLALRASHSGLYWFNFSLVVAIFLATFAISVPLHNKLTLGFNLEVIDQLIFTNWVRTLLYTIHAPLVAYLWRTV